MNTTAFDLVSILRKIEVVKSLSWLSDSEKKQIYDDMHLALPPDLFCRTCQPSLEIVKKHLGEFDGRTKEPKKEVHKKANSSSKSQKREEELLRNSDGNGRGKGFKKTMVKQA